MSPKPAPRTPTSIAPANAKAAGAPSQTNAATQTSAAIALSMSGQLLVVVVVPIVGGHLLDAYWGTSPICMAIGMLAAAIGMVLVVRQAMQQLAGVMGRSAVGGKR